MTKHALCSVCPTLEALEDRLTPAGTVTGSLAGGVWRLTGDNAANVISVASTGKQGAFAVTGNATTVAGVTNPKGVHKIVFDMKAENDDVRLNVARLSSMVFNGGDGSNQFSAERFVLANGLQLVNGAGMDFTYLGNFKIGGSVNINNGSGGSDTVIATRSAAEGFNNIAGNVNVTNRAGVDYTVIFDTNVGGNITSSNGAGDGTRAGFFEIYNRYQTGRRSAVGGNVTVTFQDGTLSGNVIGDTVVRGNVLFHNGSGPARTTFDAYATRSPVIIAGRLTIAGTGTNLVAIGQSAKHTGLRVGKNVVIDVLKPTDLTLQAFNLFVAGQTKVV